MDFSKKLANHARQILKNEQFESINHQNSIFWYLEYYIGPELLKLIDELNEYTSFYKLVNSNTSFYEPVKFEFDSVQFKTLESYLSENIGSKLYELEQKIKKCEEFILLRSTFDLSDTDCIENIQIRGKLVTLTMTATDINFVISDFKIPPILRPERKHYVIVSMSLRVEISENGIIELKSYENSGNKMLVRICWLRK